MYTIDNTHMREYADQFFGVVNRINLFLDDRFPGQTAYNFHCGGNFHDGFILMEEGYKNAAFQKQEQYLNPPLWNDEAIENGTVINEVMSLIYDDELKNLVDWRDKDDLKNQMADKKEIIKTGKCFRDIFCSNDDKASFKKAQDCIGDKFPIISYLFFVKNPEKYLPLRPDIFHERLQIAGINGWKKENSFESYVEFINAIEDVQLFLMDYFQNETITLLDAHSYVWMAWMSKKTEKEVLQIAEEHCRDALKSQTRDILGTLAVKARNIESDLPKVEGKEKESIVKVRVNQGIFRNLLLKRYDKCCLCGVSNIRLLSASHIKPWKDSLDIEKLDPDNGFIMCPNHDKLFDEGYISFDENGGIIIAEELKNDDRIFMNVHPGMTIELTEGNKNYLQYHREHVYGRRKL